MIQGVATKTLKVIADERGYLMEMMRSDDPFFQKFGQCYLSVVYPGVVKGWHYHEKQTDHFVIVKGMAKYNFKKVACNHCTGLVAVQRMIDLGYPVVKGSGQNGSKSDLYVGNGDEVMFG